MFRITAQALAFHIAVGLVRQLAYTPISCSGTSSIALYSDSRLTKYSTDNASPNCVTYARETKNMDSMKWTSFGCGSNPTAILVLDTATGGAVASVAQTSTVGSGQSGGSTPANSAGSTGSGAVRKSSIIILLIQIAYHITNSDLVVQFH